MPASAADVSRLEQAENVDDLIAKAAAGRWKKGRIPELWDGRTAGRASDSLRKRAD